MGHFRKKKAFSQQIESKLMKTKNDFVHKIQMSEKLNFLASDILSEQLEHEWVKWGEEEGGGLWWANTYQNLKLSGIGIFA